MKAVLPNNEVEQRRKIGRLTGGREKEGKAERDRATACPAS